MTRILALLLCLTFASPAHAIHHSHRGAASLGGGGLPLSLSLAGAHVFNSNNKDYAVGVLNIPASGGNFTGTLTFSNAGVCAGLGAQNGSFQIVTSGLSVPIYTLATSGSPLWSPSSGSFAVCLIATQGGTSVHNNFAITGFRTPGVSSALYNHPYYVCNTNYYVATTGSDSTGTGSAGNPWRTRQKADTAVAGGGTSSGGGVCVNVVAGTYTDAETLTAGGSQASSTGYLTYRCATLGACIMTADNVFDWPVAATSRFVILDGFSYAAANPTNQFGTAVAMSNIATSCPCIGTTDHIWVLNSEVSGYGQSGIQTQGNDYFYVINSKVHNNAGYGCGPQGSGISYGVSIGLIGYTPTSDDLSNIMVGQIGDGFHNAVMYNWLYNNAEFTCNSPSQPFTTDGNNLIIDESGGVFGFSGWIPYSGGFLVANNVTYNAGGKGAHFFASSNVTFANNSCFNSQIDPTNNTTGRACIGASLASGLYQNTIIDNLAIGIPVSYSTCDFNQTFVPDSPYNKWQTGIDTFSFSLVTSTLNGAIGSGATTLVLTSATGFPSANGYIINVDRAGTNEEMQVTGGAGTTTLTVTRGYAATTPASHASGVTVDWVQTDIQNNITQNIGGVTSCVAFFFGGTGDYFVEPPNNSTGDTYPLGANKTNTSPGYNHVGDISVGSMTVPPNGIDFSLSPTSAAIGYHYSIGGMLPTWLPWWDVDAGAIPHQLPSWP
jgi:hypothetical protein